MQKEHLICPLAAVLVAVGLGLGGRGAALADAVDANGTAEDANAPSKAQADPTGAKKVSKERIAKLVKQLDGKDVKKALLAYDQLMEIGPPAVKPVYNMARKSRSRDTRIRSVVLIREIIKRSKEKPAPQKVDAEAYPWTEPVGGIAMRLSLDRDVAKPGQLVRLRVDFRNTTKKPVAFAPLTMLNTPRGGGSKAEGKLGPKRASGKLKAREFKKRPLTMALSPGQTVTYRLRLNEKLGMQHKVMLMHEAVTRRRAGLPLSDVTTFNWQLPKGENQLQFTYYAASKGLIRKAERNITQTVSLTVQEEANKEEDKES
jgi:hypothetical protein